MEQWQVGLAFLLIAGAFGYIAEQSKKTNDRLERIITILAEMAERQRLKDLE